MSVVEIGSVVARSICSCEPSPDVTKPMFFMVVAPYSGDCPKLVDDEAGEAGPTSRSTCLSGGEPGSSRGRQGFPAKAAA